MSTNENELRGVAGRINPPRRWETGRLFWLPMRTAAGVVGLGLSGVDGTRHPASTLPVQEDLRVLAGTTDLESSMLTMRDAGERLIFSNADTQIRQLFGKRQLVRNYKFYKTPFLLAYGNQLAANVLNLGAEVGGHLIFLCAPVNAQTRIATIPETAFPFNMVVDLGLAGTANERKVVETIKSKTAWTVLFGAGTNLTAISLRIRDAEGQMWQNDPVPIWAFAAFAPFTADPRTMGQIITQLWPRAYLLPPGASLQIEAINPAAGMEANGQIFFEAARWPA